MAAGLCLYSFAEFHSFSITLSSRQKKEGKIQQNIKRVMGKLATTHSYAFF